MNSEVLDEILLFMSTKIDELTAERDHLIDKSQELRARQIYLEDKIGEFIRIKHQLKIDND